MATASSLARVDLSRIDRSLFKVTAGNGRVLVHPHANKRRWSEDELHLRSIVTDESGRVLSLGFPKFFNFGEHAPHDARFAQALDAGAVEFPEKLDGSLIVADIDADGALSLRTRQSLGLSELRAPIEALVRERYPRLGEALAAHPLVREGCSVLFEFLNPSNPIVLRYERPALVLLALTDKRSLAVRWDEDALASIARDTGVDRPNMHALPADAAALRATLDTWSDREGVVARAIDANGAPLLIKIKTASYLRLHAHRARLGGGNAQRVAFLLGCEDEASFTRALEARGLDYEAITFARENIGDYFARRARVFAALSALRAEFARATPPGRAEKRALVERARAFVDADRAQFAEPVWFDVAIKLFEGRDDAARIAALSALMGEPGPSVRQWLEHAERELRAVFSREVREEE